MPPRAGHVRASAALLCAALGAILAAAALGQDGDSEGAASTAPARPAVAESRWVVGDLHVHVSPPDAPGHASLSVETAIAAARRGGLDFIVLTPHAAHTTATSPSGGPLNGQRWVRERADVALESAPDRAPLVVSGWEWTRESPGHLGLAFCDVAKLVEFEPRERASRAVRAGALVTVNHPFFRRVASDLPLMKMMRADRHWRPFVDGTADPGDWNAIEVWHDRSVWVERMHATRAEQFPDTQMLAASLAAWDVATAEGRRRITALGGSDAHGKLPYAVAPLPVTSVLVEELTEAELRRGLVGARVTFGEKGGVAAREFAATSDVEGERAGIGDSLRARRQVTLTWDGEATLVENGERVGVFDGGTTRTLASDGAFGFWRIEKAGDAYSNMIYANLRER